MSRKPKMYREFIDQMVRVCHEDQGQVYPDKVRKGVWNQNATQAFLSDQHQINLLLNRLNTADRELLAQMLAMAFEGGVFETLKALESRQVIPFESGYEGSPYNDFVGRLADWQWPERD